MTAHEIVTRTRKVHVMTNKRRTKDTARSDTKND